MPQSANTLLYKGYLECYSISTEFAVRGNILILRWENRLYYRKYYQELERSCFTLSITVIYERLQQFCFARETNLRNTESALPSTNGYECAAFEAQFQHERYYHALVNNFPVQSRLLRIEWCINDGVCARNGDRRSSETRKLLSDICHFRGQTSGDMAKPHMDSTIRKLSIYCVLCTKNRRFLKTGICVQ